MKLSKNASLDHLMDMFPYYREKIDELKKSDQAYGSISIGQLSALLRVHPQPINPVIFRESHRDTLS